MGSSPRNIFRTASAITNPIDAVISNNVSSHNALRQLYHPERLSIAAENYGKGGALTPQAIYDQGSAWTKSSEQKDQIAADAAWAADAPNRAAIAATTAANTALRAKNLRRRASGLGNSIAGDGGAPLLSSSLAYGKSSFGG